LSFPRNLGAFAPWREEFPTPSTFDARLFAQAAQIFNYSNTKASDILIMNFVPHHFLRCAAETSSQQVAEKKFGMLRVPQHERDIISEINSPPFVLSDVEGLREDFH
jgi:hypothetical protein